MYIVCSCEWDREEQKTRLENTSRGMGLSFACVFIYVCAAHGEKKG